MNRAEGQGASDTLNLTKWNMVSGGWVAVFLCKPEIDNKNGAALITETHQDILRLDIAMDISMRVDLLNARNL